MANYKLGPVIGKIGGEVEIITEQVEIGENDSRTWELPDGWEAGKVLLQGALHNNRRSASGITIFGEGTPNFQPQSSGALHAVGDLPGTVTTSADLSWSGTVTLIRTA